MTKELELLLIKLIETPSFDGTNKRAIVQIIRQEFTALPKIKLTEIKSAGLINLIAKTGSGKTHIWSLCHADTVKPVPGWKTDPLKPTKQGDKIVGLGASDMKGPLAINIELLKWASLQNLPFTFSLCITQDEELGGKNGLPVLLKKPPHPAFVIVNESTPEQKLSLQEPGVIAVQLNWHGQSTHCSQGKLSQNTIFKAAKFLVKVNQTFTGSEFIVNPTLISAGTAQNVTPAQTQLTLDIRFLPPHNSTSILHKLHQLKRGADLKVLVKGEARKSKPDKLFNLLHQTFIDQGIKQPTTHTVMGSTDARFLHGTNINSAVFGNDIQRGNRHAPNEFVILSELKQLLKLDQVFLTKLAQSLKTT